MKKIYSILIAIALCGTVLTSCSSTETSSATTSGTSNVPTGLTGSVNISGSSALQPLVQAAADALKAVNIGLSITVNPGGSGIGLQNVSDKTVDIGNSDIFAEEKLDATKSAALVDHQVCVVGVAPVVNPKVGVTNITAQQLIDIFTGKTTNWKDVGGIDKAIVIINRPASSGTRALFKKYGLAGKTEATGTALTEDNNGTIKQTVAQTAGSVSYLAFSYLTDSTVTALSIDGKKPTYDNVYSDSYAIWGYEHMYTYGEATGVAKSVIDFIKSPAFSQTMTDKGYGLISKMTVNRNSSSVK